MIWQLSRSSRVRLGFGFEREIAAGAFPSLSRSPTEEEEGPDMRDPHVSGSGEWFGARAGAQDGSRQAARVGGEVGSGWAEAEEKLGRKGKRQPGRGFIPFLFPMNSKSKFKFKIQAKLFK